jgi:hypothetical protein
MGRFTQKAARSQPFLLVATDVFWVGSAVTFGITDLKTRDQRLSCRELSGAGGEGMWALYDRWTDCQHEPGRGWPAALRLSRGLMRGVARCRSAAAAAKLACAEIGG